MNEFLVLFHFMNTCFDERYILDQVFQSVGITQYHNKLDGVFFKVLLVLQIFIKKNK